MTLTQRCTAVVYYNITIRCGVWCGLRPCPGKCYNTLTGGTIPRSCRGSSRDAPRCRRGTACAPPSAGSMLRLVLREDSGTAPPIRALILGLDQSEINRATGARHVAKKQHRLGTMFTSFEVAPGVCDTLKQLSRVLISTHTC